MHTNASMDRSSVWATQGMWSSLAADTLFLALAALSVQTPIMFSSLIS